MPVELAQHAERFLEAALVGCRQPRLHVREHIHDDHHVCPITARAAMMLAQVRASRRHAFRASVAEGGIRRDPVLNLELARHQGVQGMGGLALAASHRFFATILRRPPCDELRHVGESHPPEARALFEHRRGELLVAR